jgi:hypothetical protein
MSKRCVFASVTCAKAEKRRSFTNLRYGRIQSLGPMSGNAVSARAKLLFELNSEPRLTATICTNA